MNRPEIGHPFYACDWYRSPEERSHVARWVRDELDAVGAELGVVFGPPIFEDFTPEEAKAPPPREGFDVRGVMLLVGTAPVIGYVGETPPFIELLDEASLHRLRQETVRQYRESNPDAPALTGEQIDGLVSMIGAQVMSRRTLH